MRTLAIWMLLAIALPVIIGVIRHLTNPRRREQWRIYNEGVDMGLASDEALERAQRQLQPPAFRIPDAYRAQVERFLQQRDINLVEPGNDSDVFDLVQVVGVLVDSGVSAYRDRGVKAPLTKPQFQILTGLTIAVAAGVATLVGDETPWEPISSLANTRLVVRYGTGIEAAALAALAPQNYNTMCEVPGTLRLFECIKKSSMAALSTNDIADVTKVAELIAVGLEAAESI